MVMMMMIIYTPQEQKKLIQIFARHIMSEITT